MAALQERSTACAVRRFGFALPRLTALDAFRVATDAALKLLLSLLRVTDSSHIWFASVLRQLAQNDGFRRSRKSAWHGYYLRSGLPLSLTAHDLPRTPYHPY